MSIVTKNCLIIMLFFLIPSTEMSAELMYSRLDSIPYLKDSSTKKNVFSIEKLSGNGYEFDPKIVIKDKQLILAGNTDLTFGDSQDIILTKLRLDGTLIKGRTFGHNNREGLIELLQLNNGDFLLAGYSESPYYTSLPGKTSAELLLIRVNSDLEVIWMYRYNLPGNPCFTFSFIETKNNEILIQGEGWFIKNNIQDGFYKRNKQEEFFASYLMKLNDKGEILWCNTQNKNSSWSGKVIETPDNQLLSINHLYEGDDKFNFPYISIINDDGSIKNSYLLKIDNLDGSKKIRVSDVVVTQERKLLILARGVSTKKHLDDGLIFLLQLDEDLQLEWAKKYSFETTPYKPRDIFIDENNSIILTGFIKKYNSPFYDGFIMRLNKSGDLKNLQVFAKKNSSTALWRTAKAPSTGFISYGIDFPHDRFRRNSFLFVKYKDPSLFSAYKPSGNMEEVAVTRLKLDIEQEVLKVRWKAPAIDRYTGPYFIDTTQ